MVTSRNRYFGAVTCPLEGCSIPHYVNTTRLSAVVFARRENRGILKLLTRAVRAITFQIYSKNYRAHEILIWGSKICLSAGSTTARAETLLTIVATPIQPNYSINSTWYSAVVVYATYTAASRSVLLNPNSSCSLTHDYCNAQRPTPNPTMIPCSICPPKIRLVLRIILL